MKTGGTASKVQRPKLGQYWRQGQNLKPPSGRGSSQSEKKTERSRKPARLQKRKPKRGGEGGNSLGGI